MNANVVARQQAQQQLSENEMVLKVRRARSRRVDFFPLTSFLSSNAQELEILEDDAKVYKLTGPVLIKQDLSEARGNVEKRLDYIRAENERLEKASAELEKKQRDKQQGIIELQQKMMQLANPSGEGA